MSVSLPKGWTLRNSGGYSETVRLTATSPDGFTRVETERHISLDQLPGDFQKELAAAFEELCTSVANIRANKSTVHKLVELWKDN